MYERSSSRNRNKGLGLALLVPFSFLRATERERIPGYFLLHSYPYPSLLNSSLIGKTVVWYLMVQNGKTIIRSVVYLEATISRLTHGVHFFSGCYGSSNRWERYALRQYKFSASLKAFKRSSRVPSVNRLACICLQSLPKSSNNIRYLVSGH